ncbi:MAG: DUF5004 domain-containing protein [Bacteroidales bacterium]|nr:DUF5004 domain-containing protein [Bacteroidales bacterium]
MKKLLQRLLLLAIVLLVAYGCEEQEDGSYVPPITRYELIHGTWKLQTIKMTDELAKANNTKPVEMNLTKEFNFTSFVIALNVDSSSGEIKPTTFEVTGNAPALFATSGYWDMDTPFARSDGMPSKVKLFADEAKTQLLDELELITVPGKDVVLELRLVRYSEGNPYLSYVYRLRPKTK